MSADGEQRYDAPPRIRGRVFVVRGDIPRSMLTQYQRRQHYLAWRRRRGRSDTPGGRPELLAECRTIGAAEPAMP